MLFIKAWTRKLDEISIKEHAGLERKYIEFCSSMLPQIRENVPLASVSTFSIGGNARYFFSAETVESLKEALSYAKEKELPFFILGKGSNCLFDDRGFPGLVIQNKIEFLDWQEEKLRVGAGYSFSLLGKKTSKAGFSGLEFASGIPATVGGAVFMNAGAAGFEVKDVLTSVEFLHPSGDLQVFPIEELAMGYRCSPFQKMKGVIVAASFLLEKDEQAKARQRSYLSYRTKTQPYGEKNAGCVFRNPEGISAGALIEECGLKGAQIGKATISSLHGNFIVNQGGASSKEVKELIAYIKREIQEKKGIELKEEIRMIPYEEQ